LDSSCVLLRERESWRVVARWPEHWEGEVDFSHSILGEVAANRRTFFETFRLPHDSQSLRQIEAVVASPILNEQQQLMGVLYGSRRYGSGEADAITPLEAQFVQLLAAAVAAGLMRQEREVEAARLRVQFEQFFSPGLAAELERDPGLLEARARDITMLFADLRGFSGLAERIGPRETFRLMADVLDRLTAVLVAEGGVIIDYYGDGVAVMWNAPLDQPAHAAMACRAAGGLLNELPALNQAWSATLGRELALGIGIHTGTALVGNSGSRKRLKYGPRGHTVNVASRLEQATKQVGLPVLLSEAAAVGLTNQVAVRRICRARLQGMSAPVVLYTLADAAGESGQEERYQHAVALFESRQTAEARRELASLAASGHALSQVLLNHLAQMPDDATGTYGGVLDLTEK
jgi:adenylate cyclase